MKHVLFFQYGDFAADYRRFLEGGAERYRDQWLTVKLIADMSQQFRITTLVICDRPHREEFSPSLCSIGITAETAYRASRILPILQGLTPDRMILRTPHRYGLLWARVRGIPTLPVFADMFSGKSLRKSIENRLLRWSVSGPNVPCVSNHSLSASRSLQTSVGLPATRIVPWDRPPLTSDPQPKPPAPTDRPLRAFYAGLLLESKGIGDCLQAAALLKDDALEIDFAGPGDSAAWTARAADLGLSRRIRFLGTLANDEVRARMRAADVVLVPSRHEYDEGLPNTLCEALAARTPVVISDHPAFASRLRTDEDCLIVPAADPQALAQALTRLAADSALQSRLSRNGPAALAKLRFGLDWFVLVRKFVSDPTNANHWVNRNNLEIRQTSLKTPE